MDYHIYIHSKGEEGASVSPTTPKSPDIATPTKPTAKTKIPKGVKVGAGILAATKIIDKAVSTVVPYVARETGYFETSRQWSNMKAAISVVFNPFGTIMNAFNYSQNLRLENARRDEQRTLLGDSTLTKTIRRI